MKKLLNILLCAASFYGCSVSYVPDSIYDNRTVVRSYPYIFYNPTLNYLYYPYYYYRPAVPYNPQPFYHGPRYYGPRRGR